MCHRKTLKGKSKNLTYDDGDVDMLQQASKPIKSQQL